jgi:hypothetical protein
LKRIERKEEKNGEFENIEAKKIEGATSAGLLALRVLHPLIDP